MAKWEPTDPIVGEGTAVAEEWEPSDPVISAPPAPRLTPAEAGKRATETFNTAAEMGISLGAASGVVDRVERKEVREITPSEAEGEAKAKTLALKHGVGKPKTPWSGLTSMAPPPEFEKNYKAYVKLPPPGLEIGKVALEPEKPWMAAWLSAMPKSDPGDQVALVKELLTWESPGLYVWPGGKPQMEMGYIQPPDARTPRPLRQEEIEALTATIQAHPGSFTPREISVAYRMAQTSVRGTRGKDWRETYEGLYSSAFTARMRQELANRVPWYDRILSAAASFQQGAVYTIASFPKAVAIAAKGLDDLTIQYYGADASTKDLITWKMGQALQDFAMKAWPTNPDLQGRFLEDALPRGAGSMLGFIVASLGGTVAAAKGLSVIPARAAPYATAALAGAAAEGTEGFEEALAMGASEDVAFQVFLLRLPGGTLEALPVGRMVARLNAGMGGKLVSVLLREGATEAFENAVQEALQQGWGNAVARMTYDPDRGLGEGVLEATAIGGITGFLASAAVTASTGVIPAGAKNLTVEQQMKLRAIRDSVAERAELEAAAVGIAEAGRGVKAAPKGAPPAGVQPAPPAPGSRADLVARVEAMREAGEEITPESVAERLAVGRDVAETLIGEVAPEAAPAEKVAPAVGVEPEVAPPPPAGALPEAVEAKKPPAAPMAEAMTETQAKKALADTRRRLEHEVVDVAAKGIEMTEVELQERFRSFVNEFIPKEARAGLLDRAERIHTTHGYLRALDAVERTAQKLYGIPARKHAEAAAARAAYRAGSENMRERAKAKTANVAELKAELVDSIREALPVSERGRLITQIRDVKTPKMLQAALARVDKVVQQYGQRAARGRLAKQLAKAKSAKLRKQYKPVVAEILKGYNITSPSDSTLTGLSGLATYLAEHPDDNFLTPREIAALDKITARNLRDMTADELDTVTNTIKHILHANKTTNRILAGEQKGRITDSAEQLRKGLKQPLEGYGPQDATPAERRGLFRRMLDWTKRIITTPRFRATLADQQSRDPGQEGGPLAEILDRPIAWGTSDVRGYEQETEDVLFAAMRAEGIDPHSAGTVQQLQELPVAITLASGKTVEVSLDGLASFYANTGDAENRRALVKDGWNPEYVFRRKTPDGKPELVRALRVKPLALTAEDVLAIRALLPESWRRIVDAVQAHKNGPLVEAAWDASQTVKGYAPETVQDHWHLRRNRAAQVRDEGELQRNWYDAALEDSGITKDRSPGANQPVITGHFTEELRNQTAILSRIAGLAVPIRDARMFLGNPTVRDTLDSNLGVKYAREWETQLRSVADVAPTEIGPITQFVKKQTGRYMLAKLALNVVSGAKTIGSIAPATHFVGASYMAKALLKGPSALGEALARARTHSPLIRERYERSMRELQSPGYTQGVVRLGPTPLAERSMFFIRGGDQTVVGTIWLGTEMRIAAENPGLKASDPEAYYEKVRRFAEDVVSWTQPFSGAALQPPIGLEAKKNPWIHWVFTMFKSQAVQNTTMAYDETLRFARSPKGKADYKRLLSAYVSLAVGAAWYFAWLQFARQLYKPLREELLGEERAELEDKISTIFNVLRATVGNVVFIDPALDMAESVARELSGLSGFGGSETPLAAIAENMTRSIVDLGKAVEDGFDDEWEKSRDHAVKGALRAAGVVADVTGMPDMIPRYLNLLYRYAAIEKEPGPPKPPEPPGSLKPPK